MTHPNHELAQTWFRRVWTEQDASAIDEMFEQAGVVKGLGEEMGPSKFKLLHQRILALVENISVEIVEGFFEDERNAILCKWNSTSKKTGAPVTMTGTIFFRVRNGKAYDVQDHWDFMGFYEQLGQLPERSFLRALDGESIGT